MTRFWIEFLNKFSGAVKIERLCKHACEQAPCPDCGETVINAGDSSQEFGTTDFAHETSG